MISEYTGTTKCAELAPLINSAIQVTMNLGLDLIRFDGPKSKVNTQFTNRDTTTSLRLLSQFEVRLVSWQLRMYPSPIRQKSQPTVCSSSSKYVFITSVKIGFKKSYVIALNPRMIHAKKIRLFRMTDQ